MQSTPVLTVTDISNYLQTLLGMDPILQNVWVSGEISNIKFYGSRRQCYLTLSDGENQLQAVMFADAIKNLDSKPENGQTVYAQGRISYYAKRGQLSFQISTLKPKGVGQKSAAFIALQKKLNQEGLFDADRKTRLPTYPHKVVVITGKASAAEADISHILTPIMPPNSWQILSATVQGPESVPSLLSALKKAENIPGCELIIIARGGGSQEDLSSFNEETLIRAMAACKIPIITGIGHESDATLAEKVADSRAATPTQAAHMASEGYAQFRRTLQTRLHQISSTLKNRLDLLITQHKDRLLRLKKLPQSHQKRLEKDVMALLARSELCNPLLRLQQGFGISRTSDGQSIHSIQSVSEGMLMATEVVDGVITSHVHCVSKNKPTKDKDDLTN